MCRFLAAPVRWITDGGAIQRQKIEEDHFRGTSEKKFISDASHHTFACFIVKRMSTDLVIPTGKKCPKIRKHKIKISKHKSLHNKPPYTKQKQCKPAFFASCSFSEMSSFISLKALSNSWRFLSVLFFKRSRLSLNSEIWFLQLVNWLPTKKTCRYLYM